MKIEAQQLSLVYYKGLTNETTALDSIDLSIQSGEAVVVSGPSGSGKTSLGLVLAGLIKATSGNLNYHSSKIDSDTNEPQIVYSPQFPEHTFFCNTVQEELEYALKRRKIVEPLRQRRIQEITRLLDIDSDYFFNKLPTSLSGGEARKVGIALIAVWQAEFMVFDEPTLAIDGKGQRTIIDYFQHLKGQDKTQLIITQDSELITEIADKLIILDKGKVLWVGKPLDYWSSSHWKAHPLLPSDAVLTNLS